MAGIRTEKNKVMIKSFWVSNSADMVIRRYMANRDMDKKTDAVSEILETVCSGDWEKLKKVMR